MGKAKPNSDTAVFRVLPRQVQQTIAATLRQWLPGKSWSEIHRLLKVRQVTVNGNLCMDAGYRLRLTDVVKVLPFSQTPPPREDDVRIRYLDKHVVVVEKPAGMTTTRHEDQRELSPRQRQHQPTLHELLPRLIAKAENRRGKGTRGAVKGGKEAKNVKGGGKGRVRAVHRLDRETSGLMVFARTSAAETHLGHQFRKHTIARRYLAIVQGAVEAQTIESRLVRDRGDGRRGSTSLPNAGKRAVTHIQPVERVGGYTLIECRLETGRTHQIRIHLAEIGHPLCGEKVYRQPLFRPRLPDPSGAPRLALSAVELGFVHPITGETMHFEMPLSSDLVDFVRRLRQPAGPKRQ